MAICAFDKHMLATAGDCLEVENITTAYTIETAQHEQSEIDNK